MTQQLAMHHVSWQTYCTPLVQQCHNNLKYIKNNVQQTTFQTILDTYAISGPHVENCNVVMRAEPVSTQLCIHVKRVCNETIITVLTEYEPQMQMHLMLIVIDAQNSLAKVLLVCSSLHTPAPRADSALTLTV